MPCLGLSPFLPDILGGVLGGAAMCQCPVSGYPHFYTLAEEELYNGTLVCQCPVSGYPHFYYCGTLKNYLF